MATRLRQDLRWITREGSTYCVMSGTGENSLAPFVLALTGSAVASGQIMTVPKFIGALLQNLAPAGLRRLGSMRKWAVLMASLQGLCLLALGLGAAVAELPLWVVFLLVSLSWAADWSIGPAWNTWMDSVVPERLRARYFARRLAFCQLIQWTTLMLASGLLYWGERSGLALGIFSALFVVAGLSRLAGAFCMSRQSEPVRLPENFQVLSVRQAYARVLDNPKARPLLYMLGAQFALQLAAPFLVPFMRQQLQLGYGLLLVLLAASTFSQILVLPRLGTVARHWGPQRLFRWSGLGLAIVPWLWLLPGGNLLSYLLIQAFTGACLAAYQMAVTLVYLEAVPVADRTSILTRFNLFNTLSMMLGSSLGALMLWCMPAGWGAYAVLFGLASLLRLLALSLLPAAPSRSSAPVASDPQGGRWSVIGRRPKVRALKRSLRPWLKKLVGGERNGSRK